MTRPLTEFVCEDCMRETGLIERTCRHGIGHPDPDSAAWMDRRCGQAGTWMVHGCDGCCRLPTQSGSEFGEPT